jgi:hypothetical protein
MAREARDARQEVWGERLRVSRRHLEALPGDAAPPRLDRPCHSPSITLLPGQMFHSSSVFTLGVSQGPQQPSRIDKPGTSYWPENLC